MLSWDGEATAGRTPSLCRILQLTRPAPALLPLASLRAIGGCPLLSSCAWRCPGQGEASRGGSPRDQTAPARGEAPRSPAGCISTHQSPRPYPNLLPLKLGGRLGPQHCPGCSSAQEAGAGPQGAAIAAGTASPALRRGPRATAPTGRAALVSAPPRGASGCLQLHPALRVPWCGRAHPSAHTCICTHTHTHSAQACACTHTHTPVHSHAGTHS